MLLAGVLLKLGTYGLLIFLPAKIDGCLSFYLRLRILGSILTALICIRQTDSKILIAYSSVVHIGVVNLGLLSASEVGYSCAVMIAVRHGLCSPILFNLGYTFYKGSHSRLMLNNSLSPIMYALLFGLITLNRRVPPRLGLWSEVLLAICVLNSFAFALPLLLLLLFFGLSYNLYFYLSFRGYGYGKEPILSVIQVLTIRYSSFFTLDFFHI